MQKKKLKTMTQLLRAKSHNSAFPRRQVLMNQLASLDTNRDVRASVGGRTGYLRL